MGILDFRKIKSYPIVGVLSAMGYGTDHIGSMYYSPFREEKTPSFHIDSRKNLWFDFGGTNQGGSNIDLVARLRNISVYDAAMFISSLSPYCSEESLGSSFVNVHGEKKNGIEICEVKPFISKYALRSYSEERCIPPHILNMYCREVYYRNNKTNSIFYALGFRNDSGGYVLRSSSFKATTKADITTFFFEEEPKKILVFEGFFNFLSYLVLKNITKPKCDVCVLNSTTNLVKGSEFISRHKTIEGWLDNDTTGRDAWTRLKEEVVKKNGIGENSFIDMSQTYSSVNDLNDYLKLGNQTTSVKKSLTL